MDLLIVESRAKSKTIQKYLGKGYVVEACNGHVQDLPNSRSAVKGAKNATDMRSGSLPGALKEP